MYKLFDSACRCLYALQRKSAAPQGARWAQGEGSAEGVAKRAKCASLAWLRPFVRKHAVFRLAGALGLPQVAF